MRYYLYRHIRLDKNEPFYIGIGTKFLSLPSTINTEYKRAFSKQRKDSKIWNLITNKTEYKVEILFESNDYEFIKEKEKEFISLYGRIDLKTGTLANMTDGGDGTIGWKPSVENLINLLNSKKNRVYNGHKTYQYDLVGNFLKEWNSINAAGKEINVHISTLHKTINNNMNNGFCKGYYWTNYLSAKIEVKPHRNDFRGKILMIDPNTDTVVHIFKYKEEALRFLGKKKSGSHIKHAIIKNNIAYGYKWKEVSL